MNRPDTCRICGKRIPAMLYEPLKCADPCECEVPNERRQAVTADEKGRDGDPEYLRALSKLYLGSAMERTLLTAADEIERLRAALDLADACLENPKDMALAVRYLDARAGCS